MMWTNHWARALLCSLLPWAAGGLPAAELAFDFSEYRSKEVPPGWISTQTGDTAPGTWMVLQDAAPSAFKPLTPLAPTVARKAVVAQTGRNPADEHFPLLVYPELTLGDFTLEVRVKMVEGIVEQMAGIAFRYQDPGNYYVVRASAKGNTFRFYKVLHGIRSNLIGPEVNIPAGTWHDIKIQCEGNRFRFWFNGQEIIPPQEDSSFNAGRLALWTKSDSVSYFSDLKLTYTPRVPPAQTLVRAILDRYPRLEALQLVTTVPHKEGAYVVGSKDETEIGQPAGEIATKALNSGKPYLGRTRKTTIITLPVDDRNGVVMAVVRVTLDRFPGETEQTSVARAMPVKRMLQDRVLSRRDLVE